MNNNTNNNTNTNINNLVETNFRFLAKKGIYFLEYYII